MTDKLALRKKYRVKRKALKPGEVEESSDKIFRLFKDFFEEYRTSNVHVFLSIEEKNEVNTEPILLFLQKSGVTTVASKADFDTTSLHHFAVNESTAMVKNDWGIPEPVNASPFNMKHLEMVLVPLLTFDKRGYRVGYGKGFYDIFLSQCQPDVKKVGLSFFPPEEHIDTDDFDVKLDFCITPDRVYKFD